MTSSIELRLLMENCFFICKIWVFSDYEILASAGKISAFLAGESCLLRLENSPKKLLLLLSLSLLSTKSEFECISLLIGTILLLFLKLAK